ncbi:formate dehydrogenase accessory protein FdhE [Phosphitispora sp. TUW77]|uniref:formate dehydrogenase accessory protein FdhE n=1 Tax=Phosphitispora sp. TUW77 TaxID=3152361 RepID=UPI003AB8C859
MHGYIEKNVIPDELLNFFRELTAIQENYSEKCSFNLKGRANTGSFEEVLQVPLLKQCQPDFDTELFAQVFSDITGMIARHRPGLKGLDAIDLISGPLLVQTFKDAVNVGDKIFKHSFNETLNKCCTEALYAKQPESQNINVGLLKFIFINSVKPFLKAFARSLKNEQVMAAENSSLCPVCGGSPDMGHAAKHDGQRYLHCSLCGHEWLCKRLKCPYCLNEDHDSLSVIFIDDVPGCRIDVCEACGSYLKVIMEERGGTKGLSEMADIETVFLDILANQI